MLHPGHLQDVYMMPCQNCIFTICLTAAAWSRLKIQSRAAQDEWGMLADAVDTMEDSAE
jgi:hypothetical protein